MKKQALILIAILFISFLKLNAQKNSGVIKGYVRDGLRGNILMNAKVTLVDSLKSRSTKTDDSGMFTFENLEAGKYLLKVEKRFYYTSRPIRLVLFEKQIIDTTIIIFKAECISDPISPFFDLYSDINYHDDGALDTMAEIMKVQNFTLQLEAHSDSCECKDTSLAYRRGVTIMKYLMSKGVERERLQIRASFGDWEKPTDCKNKEALGKRILNRQVGFRAVLNKE